MIDLSVNIAGVTLKNPVMPASGTFDAKEFSELRGFDVEKLGAVITKGTTYLARQGNPQPRSTEVASGMINYIGLQNPGVKKFAREKLPGLIRFSVPVIVNVSGGTVEEYFQIVEELEKDPSGVITGYEINISCPNVKRGGMVFGQDPIPAAEVVRGTRQKTRRLMIVKLTPNVTSVWPIAKAVIEAGADAISLCNTFKGRKKIWSEPDRGKYVEGGVSGPCIMAQALRIVSDLAKALAEAKLDVPIIGIGGISSVFDAVEFLESGAVALQIGTANFPDTLVMMRLIKDLAMYIEITGCQSLHEWRAKGFPMPKDKDLRSQSWA